MIMFDSNDKKINELTILKGILENINEAIITIDSNHTVLLYNSAAEHIFGYKREDILGRDFNTILTKKCSRNHKRAVENYINTGISKILGHETELIATRKNGETFNASFSFSVSRINNKVFFRGIVRDLSDITALKEQVLKSERLATLGQVVAEIIHEIKNPLMMIGGFATQLIRTCTNDKGLRKLNIIAQEVNRLEKLLLGMRELYTHKNIDYYPFDMNELLQEVAYIIKDDCKKKNIILEIDLSNEMAIVLGDRDKLKQVLINLVKNSIDAMEHDGNLSIQSNILDDKININISDDGCGIPEENRKKIFSPFFTTKKTGTGLGLSISKKIIEDHPGCSLSINENKEKGTLFKIIMPFYSNGDEGDK